MYVRITLDFDRPKLVNKTTYHNVLPMNHYNLKDNQNE